MARIGIIGCGFIGSFVARAVAQGKCGKGAKVVCVFDAIPAKCVGLSKKFKGEVRVAKSFREFLACKPDLVVEAASQEAVRAYAQKVLQSGALLVVASAGALLDEKIYNRLLQACKKTGAKLIVPTGAIGALDALRAARVGKISSVLLTTTKPAKTLGVEFETLKAPKVVFSGSARRAVRAFPFSVNVAAAVSLAGVGADKTKVRVVADPKAVRNVHEIEVAGEFGRFVARFENLPSKENPRTSALAAFAVVAAVKEFAGGQKAN